MASPDDADTERSWGGGPHLSAFEGVMWRAERDPRTRSKAVLVEVLDSEPEWDRLVAAHRRIVRRIARLRERIVEPTLPLVQPSWSADPHFGLGYHLQRARLPEPGTFRQLLDLAQSVHLRPLDPARPPWEAVLVEGLEGGRAAYLLKFHHSLADGMGLIQLLSLGHSPTAKRPTGREPEDLEEAACSPVVSPTGILTRGLRRQVAATPSRLVGGSLSIAGRLLRDPGGTIRETVQYGASLRRVLTPPPAERSPALRGSGRSFHYEVLDVPLADLRAAGKAAGGSLNDAYVAALLGAFRRYHEHVGADVGHMPVGLPVSLRRADDPAGGNRFGGARFAAPVAEPDPRERIRAVREFMLNAREEPALAYLDFVAPVISLLPTSLLVELTAGIADSQDFQASNVPGLGHPVYLSGSQITQMYAFGPLPGCAAMFALLSYAGTCCIAANLDPDAFAEPELFGRCLHEGFDEVLALAAHAAAAR
jgi:diacylglycerol O-acyltransferase